jgi:sugar-specific transcriptional regulator TrmB
MEAYLKTALTQLECNQKEIRLYLACYKLGASRIAELAKVARLQRSTAYVIAQQLLTKQLLIQDDGQYNKLFIAAEPEVIIRMLENKKRLLARSSIVLKDHLEELQALRQTTDILPQVRTYRGTSGLLAVWQIILGSKTELLMWTNQATERQLFASRQHQQFIDERIAKQLSVRVLTVDNAEGRELLTSDRASLRTTRLLPADTTFSAETYLFDNKVVILDYNTEIIGIVIENSLIYQAQTAIFELCWQAADTSPAS